MTSKGQFEHNPEREILLVENDTYRRLINISVVSFLTGTCILVLFQLNSFMSMERLIRGNRKQLLELRMSNYLREVERDLIWVESRLRAAVATGDISHLEGTDTKSKTINDLLDSLHRYEHNSASNRALYKLGKIALEKDKLRIRLTMRHMKSGLLSDSSLFRNPDAKRVSDEINSLIGTVHLGRAREMAQLNRSVAKNGNRARLYSNLLTALILLCSAGLCYFIIRKVGKQKRLILRLAKSEALAREAALSKEHFTSNISHEVRTPLNSILGFTQILTRRKLEKEEKQFVEAIEHAGENLLSIVNDILDLSKIEAGKVVTTNCPFKIRELICYLEAMFAERMASKGLRFTCSVDPDVPEIVIGDSMRLEQILVNLVGNSLKFTEVGYVKVRLGIKKNNIDSLVIKFLIEDTGIGIEKEKLAGVFDRYIQADDLITKNYGGTGLGLAIVKDMVDLLKGDIEVDSICGLGTTFRINLPYGLGSISNGSLPNKHPDKQKEDLGKIRILVVDDNEMNRSLMGHLFSIRNIGFDLASGAREAIDHVSLKGYDLILMDIQMPEMDGYTLTKVLRNEHGVVCPIIAMTAHAMAGEREKSIGRGMDGYLSKPIRESILLEIISSIIKQRT